MKKMILILVLFFSFQASNSEARNFYFGERVDFNYFYYSLEPYGEWIQIDGDLIVWRPNIVHVNWTPYSVGRWVWTEYGWYWDSFEPFGWATYHYGRWIYDDYYGWVWVPGYRWSPAWVEWRYNDDFIGWAPLPPYASFDVRIGIRFSFGWHASIVYWHFVPYRYFCGYEVSHYFVPYNRVRSIFSRTRYRTNYYYRNGRVINYGVDRTYVERRSGRRIRKANLRVVSSRKTYDRIRKDRNSVVVYRPSEREILKRKSVEKVRIKKAERTSIIRDKVVLKREGNIGNIRKSTQQEKRIVKPKSTRSSIKKERNYLPRYKGRSETLQRKNNVEKKSTEIRKRNISPSRVKSKNETSKYKSRKSFKSNVKKFSPPRRTSRRKVNVRR